MTDTVDKLKPSALAQFQQDFQELWQAMPFKGMFLAMLAVWCALFHVLGNSTYGYIDTNSLFAWLNYDYLTPDDEHGKLIPFVVLLIFWWDRKRFLAVPKAHWWPALILVILALLLHLVGYRVQQVRISIIAFFLGIYGLMGLVWGRAWLTAIFFPFVLFIFCFPLATLADRITVPLRLMAASITTSLCNHLLGIDVIREGTMLFNPKRTYEYEVAAACSGMRSLIATMALSMIYGFISFKAGWKRCVMFLSSIPLAVAGNVFRLSIIILASEAFGHKSGLYVHESPWLSLLPYIPAFVGMLVIGHWLREKKPVHPIPDGETKEPS